MGNGYYVAWCIGHLVRLVYPDAYDLKYKIWREEDLPIIPSEFKTELILSTKKAFYTLKKLMNQDDVSSIICATDAGREGELIFRLVYKQANCKKPIERLWISSMVDEDIKKGFNELQPGKKYEDLYYSALARLHADWIIGMNYSRLYSIRYNQKLSIGRVQTPTLSLIVNRDSQIKSFIQQPYYNIINTFKSKGQQQYQGTLRIDLKEQESKEDLIARVNNITEESNNTEGQIISVEKTEKTKKQPLLLDLTTLQRLSNKYYSFSAMKTLEIVQNLYEKKLISYPRTDSRYIPESYHQEIKKVALLSVKLLNIQNKH